MASTVGKARLRLAFPIGFATVIAALSGLLVVLFVARTEGPAAYARFAVVWSVYFLCAGIVLGVQQETARRVSSEKNGPSVLSADSSVPAQSFSPVTTSLVIGGCLALGVLLSSGLWADQALGPDWFMTVLALSAGIAVLTLYCAIVGQVGGNGHWTLIGLWTGCAALLRLIFVPLIVLLSLSMTWVTIAIASGALAWLATPQHPAVKLALRARLPGSAGQFARVTVLAMGSTGCSTVLISGFPFLMGVTARSPLGEQAGVLFAAILLTRTPLLLPMTAFNLPVLAFLSRHRDDLSQTLLRIVSGAIAGGAVLSAATVVVGPPVFAALFGREFVLDGSTLGALVGAATLLVVAILTGLACLASGAHVGQTAGWLFGALITIACLALPIELVSRTLLALYLGTAGILIVHTVAIGRAQRGRRTGAITTS